MSLRIRVFVIAVATLISANIIAGQTAAYAQAASCPLKIAEFRTRGPNGKFDEFVKLYNTSGSPYTVQTSDGTAGFALVALSGSPQSLNLSQRFTIPNGTVIPANGFYLGALANTGLPQQNGYSLGAYATPDIEYGTDIDDERGIALFDSANSGSWTLAHRIDAVGFNSSASAAAQLAREGTALASAGNNNGQYSWTRKIDKTSFVMQDTGNNAADFQFIANDGGTYNGAVSILGYPGPQNRTSPNPRNGDLIGSLIPDPLSSTGFKQNTRDYTPAPNATFGTLTIYRRITNAGSDTYTKLRFRVVEITTLHSPNVCSGCGQSDIRYLSSGIVPSGAPKGTKIERENDQAKGGGVNTSSNVEGVLDLGANPLLPGQFVDIQFVIGVETNGYFRFFVSSEGQPLTQSVPLNAPVKTPVTLGRASR